MGNWAIKQLLNLCQHVNKALFMCKALGQQLQTLDLFAVNAGQSQKPFCVGKHDAHFCVFTAQSRPWCPAGGGGGSELPLPLLQRPLCLALPEEQRWQGGQGWGHWGQQPQSPPDPSLAPQGLCPRAPGRAVPGGATGGRAQSLPGQDYWFASI